jgi:hypothetical protein
MYESACRRSSQHGWRVSSGSARFCHHHTSWPLRLRCASRQPRVVARTSTSMSTGFDRGRKPRSRRRLRQRGGDRIGSRSRAGVANRRPADRPRNHACHTAHHSAVVGDGARTGSLTTYRLGKPTFAIRVRTSAQRNRRCPPRVRKYGRCPSMPTVQESRVTRRAAASSSPPGRSTAVSLGSTASTRSKSVGGPLPLATSALLIRCPDRRRTVLRGTSDRLGGEQ